MHLLVPLGPWWIKDWPCSHAEDDWEALPAFGLVPAVKAQRASWGAQPNGRALALPVQRGTSSLGLHTRAALGRGGGTWEAVRIVRNC